MVPKSHQEEAEADPGHTAMARAGPQLPPGTPEDWSCPCCRGSMTVTTSWPHFLVFVSFVKDGRKDGTSLEAEDYQEGM